MKIPYLLPMRCAWMLSILCYTVVIVSVSWWRRGEAPQWTLALSGCLWAQFVWVHSLCVWVLCRFRA